jgi:hypothetical protein
MGAICWGLEANVSRETYGDQNAKAILVQGKGKRMLGVQGWATVPLR